MVKVESKGYRKKRILFFLKRLKINWKIYYKSGYGKAGFYLVLFFVIMTALSPVLTFHDPMNFIAPLEDTYTAQQELNMLLPSYLNYNSTQLSTTSVNSEGSYLLFTNSANGTIYGIGLGATSETPKGKIINLAYLNIPSSYNVFPVSVYPISKYLSFISSGYSTITYTTYFVIGATNGANSLIYTGEVWWTGATWGSGNPYVKHIIKIEIPGKLIYSPELNSIQLSESPPAWIPFDNMSASSMGFMPGMIIALTEENGEYNLSSYYLNSNTLAWYNILPNNGIPTTPVPYGVFFSPGKVYGSEIIIGRGTHIMAYSLLSGKLRWNTNLPYPINLKATPTIPLDYQLSPNSYNMVFIALNNIYGVYGVYLSNGTLVDIYNVGAPITSMTSSLGSSGFPSYLLVTTNNEIFSISGIGKLKGTFTIASSDGLLTYTPLYIADKTAAIFNTNLGLMLEIQAQLGKDSAEWSVHLNSNYLPIKQPILFRNAETGRSSIAFITNNGYFNMYASSGVDKNPIPPTLNSPSGNIYLLGTNSDGNDLWSQLIASFPTDWLFGITVAIGVMVIAVLAAMLVGYSGPIVSSVVETVSLVVYLIPGLALLIALASVLGASMLNIVIILTIIGWPFTTLTLIGVVRQIKARTFVEAAKVSGSSTWQILYKHMMPNMTPLLVYFLALAIGGAVAGVATLQFLGLAPLTIPTWGGMLQPIFNNFYLAAQAPWWVLPPSIILTAFIMAFIFISRGLDEVVNPRIRRQ
ncbi:MAG: ABC transporter permease [Thermoplasmata archaeon]